MESSPLRLAGYQGSASILTAAMQVLGERLQRGGWDTPIDFEPDVTARGETAAALFDSVEQGRRQLGYMASGYLSARVPELGVLDLPFSVSDRAAALAALDGEAGALLRQAVRERTGFEVLAFWDNGFRHISNAVRPIRSPADCKGLVIRTLDSAQYRAALSALGFTAVTTDVKDLVRVVETGEVHAQENPLTNLLTFSLWKHHPYVSLSQHFFGVLLLVCPRAWHEGLGAAQQAQLQEAMAAATASQRASARAQDDVALTKLAGHGVQVLPPGQIDLPAMRQATAALAQQLLQGLPPGLVRAYLPAPA